MLKIKSAFRGCWDGPMTTTPSPRNRRNPRRLLKTAKCHQNKLVSRDELRFESSHPVESSPASGCFVLSCIHHTADSKPLLSTKKPGKPLPTSLLHHPPLHRCHLHILGCASSFRCLPTSTTSSLGPVLADTSKSPNGTSRGWGNGSVSKDACCASRRTRVYIPSIRKSLAWPSTLVTPVLGAGGGTGAGTHR